MIYLTGDIHGDISIRRLKTLSFIEKETLTKDDYVIIIGDFGLVWRNSNEEYYWRKWLDDKPFTTLFVDGNHENHTLLKEFPVEEWKGGKIHRVSDSILHLMRGQVFEIDGKKFFTMGGATSIDKHMRIDGISWWKEELPSHAEIDEGIENMMKHDNTVDYILSHTCSLRTNLKIDDMYDSRDNLIDFFEQYAETMFRYKHWYFGHFHDDLTLDEKHTVLYNAILKL